MPLSFEHVIPKWISKLPLIRSQLEINESQLGNPHYLSKYELDGSGSVVGVDFVERGRSFPMNAIEVRVVCSECNEGWMSTLESSVSPYLAPLIAGAVVELSQADFTTLAKWAVKTAMMFEFNDRSTISFTDAQRHDFYETRSIPPGVIVHAAFFGDDNKLRLFHTGMRWAERDAAQNGTLGATAIVLGHVAFLVWNASHEDMLGVVASRARGREELWSELWPDAPPGPWDRIVWAPREGVGHLDIDLGAGMLANHSETDKDEMRRTDY
ncbi:hypothetical protein ACFRJ9_15455 [Paenarthrobacter sp. NPDC056912]|uniref:hypothetical protein n=1 Tax=Paenarthrobacter sp. NPDC056912 TaxID=3345965 RepID=UPI00366D3080